MAKFTINFQANTTGNHYIGYRTYNDPVNTYTVETINVIGPVPSSESLEIEVPGNLYCADDDILYEGYIIAACQNQRDSNNDGIPDLAITWSTLLVQQTDPCKEVTIKCDNTPLDYIEILTPGAGYTTASVSFTGGGGGTGAEATAFLGDGVITAVLGDGFGAGYSEGDGTQTNIPLIGIGQVPLNAGNLGTVDVTFLSGAITNIVINTPGSGYISTENPVTIDNSALAIGTAPSVEESITLTCAGSFADEVDHIDITNPGSGYTVTPRVVITGDGAAATAGAVMTQECPSLDLRDYDCGSSAELSNTPEYVIGVKEDITICADIASLATLPSNFTYTDNGNCHCEECRSVTVSCPGATTGTGTISYQTCWDNSGDYTAFTLVTRNINWDETIELGCILPNTLFLDDGNLDQPIVPSDVTCP